MSPKLEKRLLSELIFYICANNFNLTVGNTIAFVVYDWPLGFLDEGVSSGSLYGTPGPKKVLVPGVW